MTLQERVPLSTLTTFRSGGPARFVALCRTGADVREALAFARQEHCPWYVLGGGSNVLADDAGYDGLIIKMVGEGVVYEEQHEHVMVQVEAGVCWDTLVEDTVSRGLWGFENLAGIPGTVGAAPVQNIGAYGAELQQTFFEARVFDASNGTVLHMSHDKCMFSYRDSIFKRNPNLIILSASFVLSKSGEVNASYTDLTKARASDTDLSTSRHVARVVRDIRAKKFPDLSIFGTAGSFFKNPIVSHARFAKLTAQLGPIPAHEVPEGMKIPLAFILDKVLTLRGFRMDHAWLFTAQPLVIVLDKSGTSHEVDELARYIAQCVEKKTHIEVEREVRSLGK